MKILSVNQRKGIAKIKIDNPDDLWHLSKILQPNDVVTGRTTRKIKIGGERERQQAVKKTLKLTIKTQRIEYLPTANTLRIHGITTQEQEHIPLHSAHALEAELGSELIVEKPWKQYQINRLKEAEKAAKIPKALIVVLDDEQANLGVTGVTGIKSIAKIELRLAKKRIIEKQKEPYKALIDEIKSANSRLKPPTIIVASPIFWKEELLKELKNKAPEVAKKVKLEKVSTGSARAFQELIASKALERLVHESRISKESAFVEELLAEISKASEKVTYGFKETKEAVEAGAAKTLLVTDKLMQNYREKNKFEALEALLDLVERSKGDVHIISTDHEAGQKLHGLGGIAAFLRFKL